MTIIFPTHIKSKSDGFEFLVKVYEDCLKSNDNTIEFDFTFNTWFEANLCAMLGSIIQRAESQGKRVKILNLNKGDYHIFENNNFLNIILGRIDNLRLNKTTAISFQIFNFKEDKKFKDYLDSELLSQKNLPEMSNLLKNKINKSIFEIFNNAHLHGKCEKIYTCGQYFPNLERLDFTIVDLGRTIRRNVNEYFIKQNKKKLTSCKAIDWAAQYGNTTKTGSIPGGLGLGLIREFLKLNGGRLQIISAKGFWEQNRESSIFVQTFTSKFNGTIVNLEFNLSDTNSYILKEEINPDTIFN